MKRKHFILALAAMLMSFSMTTYAQVAKVGDTEYGTIEEAITAATAGQTITLLTDINGDATISKSLTIDGAGKQYTGNIAVDNSVNKNVAATVKNVNFVNGTGYAITTNRIKSITVENCTVNNYGSGFLYANKSTPTVTVKNVTVDGGNYGFHWVYGTTATLENVKMTNVTNGLYIQNYAGKTINLKNCEISSIGIWERSGSSGIQTFNFEGVNEVSSLTTSEYAKVNAEAQNGDKIGSLTEIVEDAKEGDTVKLLSDNEAEITMPEGVNLDKNGFTADGIKVVAVKIGETEYETLAEAIGAASAGQTITFLKDINENVTVTKNLTIDGAGKKYTGTMTGNASLTVTVQNVNFVNGGFAKTTKSTNGNYTFKNCTFVDNGAYAYSLRFSGASKINVEGCTVNGYMYGFLYVSSSTNAVSVKNVTVENCSNYAVYFGSGVNSATFENLTVKNSDNGFIINNTAKRAFTIKDCTMEDVTTAINHSKGTNAITCTALGVNDFGGAALSEYAKIVAGAQVGTKVYETLDAAFAAAQDGDEVKVLTAGTYALSTSGKDITITGAVEGVVFDNIGAKNMGSANVTFNNVTFDYYPNVNYTGLQHSGNLVYNNCTINGQVFLYGQSETFNKCTFNQNSADAYNVWTYGAKEVDFNECTFNSVGKSVLVYTESKTTTNDVAFTKCGLNASAPVDGKAAIEIDTSLSAGATITVDGATTATGFGAGSVSGNPLWNNKKGNADAANNDVTVVVNNETVLAPIPDVAKIGETGYRTFAEAIAAIGAGDVVIELLADATFDYNARDAYGTAETTSVTINGNGNTLTLNQKNSDWASIGLANANSKLVLKNMTIEKTGYGDTSGAWNTHAIIFSCPVEMTDVEVNNGIAVQAGATLTNVTINEANGYYGLWVNGNGQAVTVSGGAINATNGGRGVKVADQYIDAPAKATLSVTGTKFSTAKKAAVLVSSKAGADITASNVNIENVAEDKVNFVWVDEDWAQYFANVTVTGATVAQESMGDFAVTINNSAYFKTLAEAIAAAKAGETVTLLADINENVTLSKNLTIDGAGKKYTGTMTSNAGLTVTVQNVNFVNGGFDKSTKSTTGTYTIKNCTFEDNGSFAYPLRFKGASKVVVEDCTVKNYLYSFLYVRTSTANVNVKDVTVENCPSYAVYFASGVTTATFEGLTVKNANNGFVINNTADRAFTMKNCKMENVATAINHSNGTNTITCTALGVNDLGTEALSDYAVIEGATIEGSTLYGSVQGMVEKAENGQTVKLLSDIALTEADCVAGASHKVLVDVVDKDITLDMNGKMISVTHMDEFTNTAECIVSVIRVENGAGLTVTGNGTIDVNVKEGNSDIVYMFWKRGTTGHLTIENGTFHMKDAYDSMVYTNGNEIVFVKGGSWTLDSYGTRGNREPWIFNVQGAGDNHVVVTGGTYNADINRQHWSNEVVVPETHYTVANADSTAFTVKEGAVAYVNEGMLTGPYFIRKNIGYATLAEAIAEVDTDETVTLLQDVTLDDALVIEDGMDVTVSGEGKTITGCDGKDVFYVKGGKLTLTEGLNVHATTDCAIYLRGGDVFTAANLTKSGDKYHVIQGNGNYTGNVTITGGKVEHQSAKAAIYWPQNGKLTITGGEITGHSAVYIASGSLEITGGTLHGVGANGEYSGVTGGSTDSPAEALTIENVGGNSGYELISSVVITGGTFISENAKAVGSYANTILNPDAKPVAGFISGGIFNTPVEAAHCATGYAPYANEDGTYGVESLNIDELTIVDGDYTEFENQNAKTVGTLTYKRTLPLVNVWMPLYVPFAISMSEEFLADYDIAYFNDVHGYDDNDDNEVDRTTLELIKITNPNATLKANYPLVIRAKNEAAMNLVLTLTDATLCKAEEKAVTVNSVSFSYEIKGTYQKHSSLEDNQLVLGMNEDGDAAWGPLASDYSLNPFRLILTIDSRGNDNLPFQAISMRVIGEEGEDGTTFIYDVEMDGEPTVDYIYDLQGRRVLEPQKGGLYIVNGKKVVIK